MCPVYDVRIFRQLVANVSDDSIIECDVLWSSESLTVEYADVLDCCLYNEEVYLSSFPLTSPSLLTLGSSTPKA